MNSQSHHGTKRETMRVILDKVILGVIGAMRLGFNRIFNTSVRQKKLRLFLVSLLLEMDIILHIEVSTGKKNK